MIRVVVADDQAMIRQALSSLLNLESDIEVVDQAGDGQDEDQLLVHKHCAASATHSRWNVRIEPPASTRVASA